MHRDGEVFGLGQLKVWREYGFQENIPFMPFVYGPLRSFTCMFSRSARPHDPRRARTPVARTPDGAENTVGPGDQELSGCGAATGFLEEGLGFHRRRKPDGHCQALWHIL